LEARSRLLQNELTSSSPVPQLSAAVYGRKMQWIMHTSIQMAAAVMAMQLELLTV